MVVTEPMTMCMKMEVAAARCGLIRGSFPFSFQFCTIGNLARISPEKEKLVKFTL